MEEKLSPCSPSPAAFSPRRPPPRFGGKKNRPPCMCINLCEIKSLLYFALRIRHTIFIIHRDGKTTARLLARKMMVVAGMLGITLGGEDTFCWRYFINHLILHLRIIWNPQKCVEVQKQFEKLFLLLIY